MTGSVGVGAGGGVGGLGVDEQFRLAADPLTPPAVLRELAMYCPATRVVVAANPAAYPGLLEWLGSLGDPAVAAVVAPRLAERSMPYAPSAKAPVAGRSRRMSDETTSARVVPPMVDRRPKSRLVGLLVLIGVGLALVVMAWLAERSGTTPGPSLELAGTLHVGSSPSGPVVASDGTVYVTNRGDATVSVIRDDQVVATVPVGVEAEAPMVAADGTAYVINNGEKTLSVIRDDRVTDTIRLGFVPEGAAVGPDGTVFVTGRSLDAVLAIRNGRVEAKIPVGRGPRSLAVTPEGAVFVANSRDQTVSMILNDQVVDVIWVGPFPTVIGMAPDGTVYVMVGGGETGTGRETLLALQKNQVAATIPLTSRLDGMSASSEGDVYAVESSFGGSVLVIKDDEVLTTVDVGDSPQIPAVGTGGTVYVASQGDGKLSVIRNDRVVATIPVGNKPQAPAVAPDGTVYVANSDDGTVLVLR